MMCKRARFSGGHLTDQVLVSRQLILDLFFAPLFDAEHLVDLEPDQVVVGKENARAADHRM